MVWLAGIHKKMNTLKGHCARCEILYNIFIYPTFENTSIDIINTELIDQMAGAHNHNYDKLLWFSTMIQILMGMDFYVVFYDWIGQS